MNSKTTTLIACAVAAVGSFMPWASVQTIFGTIDIAGTTGDGQITLVLALLAGRFSFTENRSLFVLGMIVCALGAVVSIVDFVNVSNKFANVETGINATIGYGLYLCIIGFVIAFLSFISLYQKSINNVVVIQKNAL